GDSLQTLAQQWRECGLLNGWRGEKFDICDQSGKPLCALERAACRPFGLMSQAVHLNGLVEAGDGLHFWIGRRSPHKAVDPNKRDNLTGGGISSGERPSEAVGREGEEEAGIPAALTPHSRPTAQIYSLRPGNRGVHNEILHIFDIV
ncbi:NUDIX hydrolase, partial [Neisseria sp. P0019.S003]|uniref:NUDIX hydrolase n=1 Tax=Neisseria sp. P0019.S003 TaxID=3436799 RepID=UPI003F7FB3AD